MSEAIGTNRGRFLAHDPQSQGLRERSEHPIVRQVTRRTHQGEIEVPTYDRGGREHADSVGRQR
jgi:hypothetical protein